MRPLNRRTALRVGCLALGAALAGCLAADGPGSDPGTTTDEPTTDPGDGTTAEPGDGTTAEPDDDPDEEIEFEVLQTGAPLVSADPPDDATGYVGDLALFDSAAGARATLDLDRLPADGREAVESFVAATDFGTSVLLHVASVGPNTCYSEVAVDELHRDGSRLVGSARALDTSEPDEGCGEAITYPAALVRVTADGPVPTEATVTIPNGWGAEGEVAASPTDPPATDPADLPGYVRPDGDPAVVPPALTCEDDEFERLRAAFDEGGLPWGETVDDDGNPVFALRVDARSFERGDEVHVSLTNVSGGERYTGNRRKFNLQVYTEAGWQDVRGYPAHEVVGYTDEAVVHGPGEGFDWRFALDADGVLAPDDHGGLFEVCPGLPAGRYRFVFWEPAVAVAVDLVE